MEIDLRVVLADALDDAAIAELQPLVASAELVAGLERLEPPQAPAVLVAADRVVRAAGLRARLDAGAPPRARAARAARGDHGVRIASRATSMRSARSRASLPYWVETPADGPPWALAALSGPALAHALDARLGLQRLPLDLGLDDPLFVQLDEGAHAGEALAGYEVLWADGSRVLLALDAGHEQRRDPRARRPRALPLPHAEPRAAGAGARARAGERRRRGSRALQAAAEPAPVTAESFLADIARYAGLAPLDDGGAIRSRHSSHRDNQRAVDALLAELRELGY